MSIETVRQRQALPSRREPYWRPLGTGTHVGYRRTDEGGHWIARAYDPGTRRRAYQALPDIAHVSPGDQFTAAVKAAREWFDHLGKGGSTEAHTVRQACKAYVKHTRRRKGDTAADDAEARFTRYVYDDPIAKVPLPKLRRQHLKEWRQRLQDEPAKMPKRGLRCRTKTEQPPPRRRSPSTVNRDMAVLRAALNLAHRDGYVLSTVAWLDALAPTPNASRRRTLYLDRQQRKDLLDAIATDDLRAFVTGLCLLPLRPGALAALKAGDFDQRQGVLTIGKDKSGGNRSVLLPDSAAALFKTQAKSKLPAAPLLSRADGTAWNKDAWKKPIAAAVASAGLPAGASAYTLRHSTITDLVTAGLDLFTVAALSGTSILMIEKHYGHLQQQRARDALAGLAL